MLRLFEAWTHRADRTRVLQLVFVSERRQGDQTGHFRGQGQGRQHICHRRLPRRARRRNPAGGRHRPGSSRLLLKASTRNRKQEEH